MARRPLAPLESGWVLVGGAPVYHRWSDPPGSTGDVVHVHGFAISGTYLEPTAARLATTHRSFVPDPRAARRATTPRSCVPALRGSGRSLRPPAALDIPGLARSLIGYLDAV